jgi:hypothetical protein
MLAKIRKLLQASGDLSIFAVVTVCSFSSINGVAAGAKTRHYA